MTRKNALRLPLKFNEAVADLLRVKPPEKAQKPKAPTKVAGRKRARKGR